MATIVAKQVAQKVAKPLAKKAAEKGIDTLTKLINEKLPIIVEEKITKILKQNKEKINEYITGVFIDDFKNKYLNSMIELLFNNIAVKNILIAKKIKINTIKDTINTELNNKIDLIAKELKNINIETPITDEKINNISKEITNKIMKIILPILNDALSKISLKSKYYYKYLKYKEKYLELKAIKESQNK